MSSIREYLNAVSFRTKLVFSIAALVVAVTGATVWRVQHLARVNFTDRFDRNYQAARLIARRSIGERLDLLERATRQMSNNPRLLAALSTDHPPTFQDLVNDDHEAFRSYYRTFDSVLLYKRPASDPGTWLEFDRFGVDCEPRQLRQVLNDLEAHFQDSSTIQWRGELTIAERSGLQSYLASACYLPEHDAILIYGARLDDALAASLRSLVLAEEDQLLFIARDRLLSSTLPEAERAEVLSLIRQDGSIALLLQAKADQGMVIGNTPYLVKLASLRSLGVEALRPELQADTQCLLLKSRRNLEQELADLRRSLLLVALIGVGLALVLAVLISNSLARPIQTLVSFVGEFGAGRFERRLDLGEFTGEVACLARAFDDLQISLLDKTRQLRESERLYRTLIANSSQAITGLRVDSGRIFAANQSFAALLGYTGDDLAELAFADCFFPEDQPLASHLLTLLRDENLISRAIRMRRGDGKELFADLRLSVVERAPDLTALVILSDETEKRSLEHQLQQSQKLESLGTLAGGVAHDFNNLLTAILGFASLAKQQLGKDHAVAPFIDHIEHAGDQAAVMTRNLLAFGRRTELQPRPINLNQIAEQVQHLLSRTLIKTIDIQLSLASNLNVVEADPSEIQQILMNLCINARDAMADGGAIEIKTTNVELSRHDCERFEDTTPGSYVLMSVSDTGSGMDSETQKRIFEPFFTTKEIGKGTGLGLAIVYGIVKAHHGILDVTSVLGEGTTFNIYLPTAVKTSELQRSAATDTVRGGNERLLLVDDEQVILDLGRETLGGLGYRVATADDGVEALERLHELGNIDLIVVDMIMPRMGGRELVERLKSENYSGSILIASGYMVDDTAEDLLADGADGFIQKPYRSEDLARKVRVLLDRASLSA